ncbi:hypothetical protein N7454_009862 [Penicillium verhagenii]|nr:hypothetical protein N7454_009862 [Penicillium verhagenii]
MPGKLSALKFTGRVYEQYLALRIRMKSEGDPLLALRTGLWPGVGLVLGGSVGRMGFSGHLRVLASLDPSMCLDSGSGTFSWLRRRDRYVGDKLHNVMLDSGTYTKGNLGPQMRQ